MSKKKKFKDTRFAKFFGKVIRNVGQTFPVVGTLITAADEAKADPQNLNSTPKLTAWHWLRIVLGLGVAYAIYKGFVTMEVIEKLMELFG